MIIDQDLLGELGINFMFKEQMMEWDTATTTMIDPDQFNEETIDELEHDLFYMHDPETTEAERIQDILNAKYCKADLALLDQESNQLSVPEQQELLSLLRKYEQLFDGTVGSWNTESVDLILKDPNCQPYHAKPYLVPQSQEKNIGKK